MENIRKIEQTGLNEGKNKLEINSVDGKFNEWLALDIDFAEKIGKFADKVEKEDGHIVYVFNNPANFVRFLKEIQEKRLYKYIPTNYVILKWNVWEEVRAEVLPKDKAEMFVETAIYSMAAGMYDKDYFENLKNKKYEDYVVGEEE